MVWDEISKPAIEFVPLTLGWWEDFRIVHASSTRPIRPFIEKWKKPAMIFIKLNIDASFHQPSAGLGGVFRDSDRSFLGGFIAYQIKTLVPLIIKKKKRLSAQCLYLVDHV